MTFGTSYNSMCINYFSGAFNGLCYESGETSFGLNEISSSNNGAGVNYVIKFELSTFSCVIFLVTMIFMWAFACL